MDFTSLTPFEHEARPDRVSPTELDMTPPTHNLTQSLTIDTTAETSRPVKLDLSDEIINIDHHVNVHKSLLRNISYVMNLGLEKVTEGNPLSLFSSIATKPGYKRGLKLWAGFLYGQSMIQPIENYSERESDTLVRVYEIAQLAHDTDALDAALEALRVQLYHNGESAHRSGQAIRSIEITAKKNVAVDVVYRRLLTPKSNHPM